MPTLTTLFYEFANDQPDVGSYSVKAGGTSGPNSWTFEGITAADIPGDTNWVVLDTQSSVTWSTDEKKRFYFRNSTTYRKFRLNITGLNGDSVEVVEFEIFASTQISTRAGALYDKIGFVKPVGRAGSKYDVTGAVSVSSRLGVLYDTREGTGGPKSIVLVNDIRVAHQNSVVYGALVGRQLQLVASFKVTRENSIVYAIRSTVRKQLSAVYDMSGNDRASKQIALSSTHTVAAQNSVVYSLRSIVRRQLVISQTHVTPVAKQLSVLYDLLLRDRVQKQLKAVYSLIDISLVNVTNLPFITFQSRTIAVEQVDLSIDEGSYVWQANVTLLHYNDFTSFKRGDTFDLDLAGEVYSLQVVSKDVARDDSAEPNLRLVGMSPAVRHDFPQALPFSKVWDTPVLARTAAEEAIGESIDWQILNWTIPANRLGITDGAPIQIVQDVVDAVGGVLESKPDGTLRARPKFSISVPKFDQASIDQTYLDIVDNLSVSESFEFKRVFNRFRVSDIQGRISDSMKFEFDEDSDGSQDPLSGVLKVFPNPWRTDFIVTHTQDESIELERIGVVVEQVVEEVEITDGQGSLSNPIETVQTVEWIDTDLGGITFIVGERRFQTTHSTLKYSLAKITYTTRFIRYDVTGVPDKSFQFLLEDQTV